MRRYLLLMLTLALLPGLAHAAGSITAHAGKYTVEVTSQPSPPTVGENVLIFTVKDGGKPLSGAGVDVHIDMTTMPMPADVKAAPGAAEGEYGATVNFSMAGSWKVDVTVRQMAGMTMAGDGTAHFIVGTGKGITAKSGMQIPWFGVLAVLVLLAIIVTLLFWKRLSKQNQGYVVGVLTLLIVLVGTVWVVRKFRDVKTSTVIASATMNMDTSTAAPGTAAVTAEPVTSASFQATAGYTGTVVPDIEEDVYPRVMGRLVFMPYYPGDQIAAGQVVAKLDSAELAAKEAQAAFGSAGALQGATAADADIATARAGHARALKAVDQAQAQLTQMQAGARGAESGVKAAQSDLNSARQMAHEAESAVTAAQAGIDQANEAVTQAQSDVDSMQADVTYWTSEIAREKKLYEQGAIAREELDKETAQAAAANAKLNQAKAAVRTAQAGVTRAKQETIQAQARQAAAQAAIATAEARVEQAQADRDSATGKITEAQATIQTAQADVHAAEAGVSGATAKAGAARSTVLQSRAALTEAGTVRGYTVIGASTGGVVTARNIAPGILVQPGMSILKIAKIDAVRIQANVSEADMPNILLGQVITAHSIDAPNQPIIGHITAIYPARDTSSRTSIVEARVPNPGYRLKPGQYLTVEINLGSARQSVLSVPNSALISRDGQSSVFLAVKNAVRSTATQIPVTIGRIGNDRTEIVTGLKAGDLVITAGQNNLHDGDAVTIIPSSSPSQKETAGSGND